MNAADDDGVSPLICAAGEGRTATIKLLLRECKACLPQRGCGGPTLKLLSGVCAAATV